MSQIIYTMQFKGELSPVGTSPNVMKAKLVANCICMTMVGPMGYRLPWSRHLASRLPLNRM